MDEVIFAYCERGRDPGFWAEPLNAVTNASFLVAGLFCLLLIRAQPADRRDALAIAMTALVLIIGVGSFLFHTFAQRWSALADVIPIAIFMLTAVFTASVRLFGAPLWGGFLAVAGFVGLMIGAAQLRGLLGEVFGPATLFANSLGYAPAFLVLAIMAVGQAALRRPAAADLGLAAALFAVSLTFRTIDTPFCEQLTFGGTAIGSHFLWHLFNGAVLFYVTRAVIRHGRAQAPA